jgi:HPt (histidine-containing phosphotransfer) domain-containing protein
MELRPSLLMPSLVACSGLRHLLLGQAASLGLPELRQLAAALPQLEELVVQLAEAEVAEAEEGMQQALDALAPLCRLRSLESNFVPQGSALRLPAWPKLTKLCEAGMVPMAGDPKALPHELCSQLQARAAAAGACSGLRRLLALLARAAGAQACCPAAAPEAAALACAPQVLELSGAQLPQGCAELPALQRAMLAPGAQLSAVKLPALTHLAVVGNSSWEELGRVVQQLSGLQVGAWARGAARAARAADSCRERTSRCLGPRSQRLRCRPQLSSACCALAPTPAGAGPVWPWGGAGAAGRARRRDCADGHGQRRGGVRGVLRGLGRLPGGAA